MQVGQTMFGKRCQRPKFCSLGPPFFPRKDLLFKINDDATVNSTATIHSQSRSNFCPVVGFFCLGKLLLKPP